MATREPIIAGSHLEGICLTLADTEHGLKGTEIGKILGDCGIQDTDPSITKYKRLYNAFVSWQNKHQCSNAILQFISAALQPVRYVGKEDVFQARRFEVNKRLAFIGIEVGESGRLRKVKLAKTISEVEQRVNQFKHKLEQRCVHKEVIKFCNAELLASNYFHSVFEAVKSIFARLRSITGLTTDGNRLVDTCFTKVSPLIQINNHLTETEINEHQGLANLIRGLIGMIRNPIAHVPKILFVIEEEEALDLMTTVSFVHKWLDKAR